MILSHISIYFNIIKAITLAATNSDEEAELPAFVYEKMCDNTRDFYRHSMGKIGVLAKAKVSFYPIFSVTNVHIQ